MMETLASPDISEDLPQDIEAEAALLGAILLDPTQLDVVQVNRTDFHRRDFAFIFDAMLALKREGTPLDVVTLRSELSRRATLEEVGGVQALLRLGDAVPDATNAPWYADRIKAVAIRRRIIDASAILNRAVLTGYGIDKAKADLQMAMGETGPADKTGHLLFQDAAQFNALDLRVEYHIEGVLAAGPVPTILAGSFKTLKTSIVMDMLISLATGARFLGKFQTCQCKVAVMSGESGGFALQNLARRIAASAGWNLSAIGDQFHVCTGVPNLSAANEMQIVKRFILENDIKVMVIDPAYLAMKGLRTDDAGNLFAMGVFLDIVKRIGVETGCTMVLVHHNSRGATRANAGEPAELGDIAWGGFPEWAGQWVLLARREKYDPDSNGEHRLWLTAGGRDGHSTLVGVNVTEGRHDDPDGRRWEVEVEDASSARQSAVESARDRQERNKQANEQRFIEQDRDTIQKVLRGLPDGDTKSCIRDRTTLNSTRFNAAFASLASDETIEPAPVQKSNGQKYDGYRLALGLTRTHHSDSSESG